MSDPNARLPYPCIVRAVSYRGESKESYTEYQSCDHAFRAIGAMEWMSRFRRQELRKKHFGPGGSGTIIVRHDGMEYTITRKEPWPT